MISQSSVEFVTMSNEKAVKMIVPKIEKTDDEVTSITLTLPLLSAKNGYLVIHFPKEPVKKIFDQAKSLPREQQILFVQDWLVKNQNVALNKYLHDTTVHSFRCNMVSMMASSFSPSELTVLSVGTRDKPYVIDLATSKSVDKLANIKITLPLVVNFNRKEGDSFFFRVNLKLVHLTNRNLTKTTSIMVNTVRNQMNNWAEKNYINANSKQFKLALQEALSHIGVSLKEQVRRIKTKNKNTIHYLDSH
ncbi:MAG: hypothetical protein ABID61_01890 [Candidatus Micrarchaeota archaeon]